METFAYEQYATQLETVCAAEFSSRISRRYMFNGAVDGRPMANVLGSIGFPDEADVARLAEVGFDSDSIIGKSGVERFWDSKAVLSASGMKPCGVNQGPRCRLSVRAEPSSANWPGPLRNLPRASG